MLIPLPHNFNNNKIISNFELEFYVFPTNDYRDLLYTTADLKCMEYMYIYIFKVRCLKDCDLHALINSCSCNRNALDKKICITFVMLHTTIISMKIKMSICLNAY